MYHTMFSGKDISHNYNVSVSNVSHCVHITGKHITQSVVPWFNVSHSVYISGKDTSHNYNGSN